MVKTADKVNAKTDVDTDRFVFALSVAKWGKSAYMRVEKVSGLYEYRLLKHCSSQADVEVNVTRKWLQFFFSLINAMNFCMKLILPWSKYHHCLFIVTAKEENSKICVLTYGECRRSWWGWGRCSNQKRSCTCWGEWQSTGRSSARTAALHR